MEIKILNNRVFLWPVLILIGCFSCHPVEKNRDEKFTRQKTDRVVIELILEDPSLMDTVIENLGKPNLESYRWKNHLVLFGDADDTTGIGSKIRQLNMALHTNYYDDPLYVFDKASHCDDTSNAKSWKNYLMTANLVADPDKQKEYIHYHEVQFEEWPEVAEGFCNAKFQQLLVYRNDRQLMLVISIPSGKTLDELDPKTVENNPRMVEWNKRMSQYQEGITGSEPGQTWVLFEKLESESAAVGE